MEFVLIFVKLHSGMFQEYFHDLNLLMQEALAAEKNQAHHTMYIV